MEKKHIIKFMKDKKRGVYPLLVKLYSEVVLSMGIALALEIIKEDLEKEAGEKVDLNYHSLAHAIAKFKKNNSTAANQSRKWEFKDSHELKDGQSTAGRFKLE